MNTIHGERYIYPHGDISMWVYMENIFRRLNCLHFLCFACFWPLAESWTAGGVFQPPVTSISASALAVISAL